MDLETFIADKGRRRQLAAACKTSSAYLWQIATGWRGRRPSSKLAQAIEEATQRIGPEKVSKESLIFPEQVANPDPDADRIGPAVETA